MMFSAVLESTGLTAFDLSKIIENFVRHEETLKKELKRHLNS
jgi:retinoblastoma-like protein 1